MANLTATPLTAHPLTALRLTATKLGEAVARFNIGDLFPAPGDADYTNSVRLPRNDIRTVFKDINGTTPVTDYDDPIGLGLDLSQGLEPTSSDTSLPISERFSGLGDEILSPSSGFLSLPVWVSFFGDESALSIVDNKIRFEISSPTVANCAQINFAATTGRWYVVNLETDSNILTRAVAFSGLDPNSAENIPPGEQNTQIILRATNSACTIRLYPRSSSGTGQDGDEILDIISASIRELPGNHFRQSVDLDRPIWSRFPEGGVRNYLTDTVSEEGIDFVNGATGSTTDGITSVTLTGPPKERVRFNTVDNGAVITWTGSLDFRATGVNIGRDVRLVVKRSGGGTLRANTQQLTLTGDWVRYEVTRAMGADNPQVQLIVDDQIGPGTEATEFEVRRPQLEKGSSATAYQEALSEYDITEEGVRDIECWTTNGINQFIASENIDLSGTDEATLAAGAYPDADGTATELYIADTGDIRLSGTTEYRGTHGGSSPQAAAAGSVDANTPQYLIARGDVSGDTVTLTIDGATDTDTTDQGTGNLSNAALYIGRNSGASSGFWAGKHPGTLVLLPRQITGDEETDLLAEGVTEVGA